MDKLQDTIQDDDYVIGITGQLGSQLHCRQVGTVSSFDNMIQKISDNMEFKQFWPNVWFINDHGNTNLLALRRRGKKCTSKIVQSWV